MFVISLRCGIWSLAGHSGRRSSRTNQARFMSTRPSRRGDRMRRREFMSLLGTVMLGTVIECPRIAGAQQRSKLPTIGFLGPTTPAPQWVEAFLLRLHELGWTEGRNVAIE